MSGYVYLIGSTVFGWYKIGKSKTPEVRVRDLGILLPFKIKVIAVWSAENHSAMEKALHEMYADKKINGEWFEFRGKEVHQLIDKIPSEVRVYPSQNAHPLDAFSNIEEDTKVTNKGVRSKILGVRTQKLRGDFTPEEREQRKIANMEKYRLQKLEKQKAREQINT